MTTAPTTTTPSEALVSQIRADFRQIKLDQRGHQQSQAQAGHKRTRAQVRQARARPSTTSHGSRGCRSGPPSSASSPPSPFRLSSGAVVDDARRSRPSHSHADTTPLRHPCASRRGGLASVGAALQNHHAVFARSFVPEQSRSTAAAVRVAAATRLLRWPARSDGSAGPAHMPVEQPGPMGVPPFGKVPGKRPAAPGQQTLRPFWTFARHRRDSGERPRSTRTASLANKFRSHFQGTTP